MKKIIKRLAGPVIILLIILVGVLFIAFYQEEDEPEEIIKVNAYEGGSDAIVLENEKLLFTMDPASTQFYITVKETGEIWYSNPPDAEEDPIAMKAEKDKLRSTLLLTYSTINGVDTLYSNFNYSMDKGIYQIEEGEDYVKVYYSIGNIEKEFTIPPVIEADRMAAILEQVDKSDMVTLTDYYKKYDLDQLGKKDNEEELTARYPILNDGPIYALRDTTTDSMKKKLQGIFEKVGYTYEEYLADKEKDTAEKSSEKPVFNINVIYRLEGEDLLVEIPFEEIEYREEYPIYSLSVLPYFGAAGTSDSGSLLVPEGGGALIDFNNGKLFQNSYYANVYGWDYALDRDAVVHETRTYYNVFGENRGDASFICILEQGAPYAAIQADISGKNHSYNYVNAIYNMVHREQYDVSDKYNGSMFVYEEQLPEGESITQRYRFVNSGDYVDMAGAYQCYLADKYGDDLALNTDTQAPVAVEVVGAVDKVTQVFGIPVSRPLELTTFAEAEAMIRELSEAGITNMSVKLSGWMNGGIQQKILERTKVVKSLGSRKELQGLIDMVHELGAELYLDGVTNYAYDSGILDGFFVYTDAARFVSKERAELYEYSTITYAKRESEDIFYLLRADLIYDMIDNLTDTADSLQAGVSFRDVGMDLSSDFRRAAVVSRQAAMEAQVEKLRELEEGQTGVLLNMGNDYAVFYSDLVTNMDLAGSSYTIIDRKIPFYQLAIHGYVNYTGESLNLTQNMQEELLNSAEYGAGLSFTLMDESAFTLQNTLYTQYFGADYSEWHDRMIEICTRYNEELGHTFGMRMTDHEVLENGLTCTVYEDGTKVYVNYSLEDRTAADGTMVPARDYAVLWQN